MTSPTDRSTDGAIPDAPQAERRRGGAPAGNVNAVKSGAALDLSKPDVHGRRKRLADAMRADREAAVELVRLDLEGLGLAEARGLALTRELMVTLLVRLRALSRFHEQRSLTKRDGTVLPSVSVELQTCERLVQETRRLLTEASEYRMSLRRTGTQNIEVVWNLGNVSDLVNAEGELRCGRCNAVRGHRDDHGFKDDHPTAQAPPCAPSTPAAMPSPCPADAPALSPPDAQDEGDDDEGDFPAEALDWYDITRGALFEGHTLDEVENDPAASARFTKKFGSTPTFTRLCIQGRREKEERHA